MNDKTAVTPEVVSDIPIKPIEKIYPKDKALVELRKKYPELTNYQLGKKLQELGIYSSKGQIYRRLKASDYLKTEFSELEKRVKEQVLREEYPLARKVVRKVLKDKDIDAKTQYNYTKLVYDHALGSKFNVPNIIGTINIQPVQVAISKDLD